VHARAPKAGSGFHQVCIRGVVVLTHPAKSRDATASGARLNRVRLDTDAFSQLTFSPFPG